ncbi:MAG: phage holin family protein [Brevinematales bacterium]|nr:phage holin family protein [Brevinematales bacterium]
MIDLRGLNIPLSLTLGLGIGFLIGMVVGIASGGFLFEIIFRSILSSILVGGVLYGVEQLIRKFAPEILEVSTAKDSKGVDIKEDEDMSISDLYSENLSSGDVTYNSNLSEEVSQEDRTYLSGVNNVEDFESSELSMENIDSIDSGMKFSEDNVFSEFEPSNFYSSRYYPSSSDRYRKEDQFSPLEFDNIGNNSQLYTNFSSAELGVTGQSKGGSTQDFIIPSKGKPIPKDYKKMAEAIRTKLKEDQ